MPQEYFDETLSGGSGTPSTGGVTQADLSNRIRSLVASQALSGNTSVWPDSKIPDLVTRDAELAAILAADYLTETQIASLSYLNEADLLRILAGRATLRDRGAYDSAAAYVPGEITRRSGAAYLNIRAAAAGTQAVTGPGTGSDWKTHWYRLGFADGLPDSLTGGSLTNNLLTLTRASGKNPVAINLAVSPATGKIGFNFVGEADFSQSAGRFAAHTSGDGIDVPTVAADEIWAISVDDANYGFELLLFESGLLGQAISATNPARAANDAASDSTAMVRLSLARPSQNPVEIWLSKTATGKLLMASNQSNLDPAPLKLWRLGPSGTSVPAIILPSVTAFNIEGTQHFAAGADIGGQRYNFASQISQAAHASAVRVVGFAGTDRSPSAVTVLDTLTSAQFPHAIGILTVPAGVTLVAAGDVYTLRLEVYADGQTTAEDPVAYQDYRISALAAAAQVHFGAIPDSNDADDIVFANHDISSAALAAGSWVVSGLAGTAGEDYYRIYWAVPVSAVQPTAWMISGLTLAGISSADRTIDGTDYKIYLLAAVNAVDNSFNGTTIDVA